MFNETIREIGILEALEIMYSESPYGKYIYPRLEQYGWNGLDNSEGKCVVENFDTKEEAIAWLKDHGK